MDERPERRGKRYRLRGLAAMMIAGLLCWAIVIWVLVMLFT